MSQFYAAIMTNKGVSLLAEAIAGNARIQFTTMVAGDGEYTEAERAVTVLQTMTSLKSQKQSVGFSSIAVESGTSVHLTGAFDNEKLGEGYYVREVGIYAKNVLDDEADPVLYSITVAQFADYMPPYNGLVPTTIIQEYFATVNNSSEVTLLAGSGAYALAEDLGKESKRVNELEQRLENNTQAAKDYTDGAYQQSTGYTDQKIADLINGAPDTLDTLGEIAKAMAENEDVVTALHEAMGKKANQAEMESWLGTKLDTTGDAKANTVTFTSSDTETPSGWMNFDLFKSGETFKAILEKISIVGRNLRYIWKFIGNTDISAIGDGTVTGALDSLNGNFAVQNITSQDAVLKAYDLRTNNSIESIDDCNNLPRNCIGYTYPESKNSPGNSYVIFCFGLSDAKVQIAISVSNGSLKTRGFASRGWTNWA